MNAQLSISGGSEYSKYLLGANYRKEGTVYPGDFGYNKTSVYFNTEQSTKDRNFTSTINFQYTKDKNNLLKTDLGSYYNSTPNFLIYDSLGNLNWRGGTNPFGIIKQKAKQETENLTANITLKANINRSLSIKSNFGYSKLTLDQVQVFPKSSQNPNFGPVSYSRFSENSIRSFIVEPQIDYNKKIYDHEINALIGATYQHTNNLLMYIEGRDYTSELLMESLAGAGTIGLRENPKYEYKYASIFGRISYNWNQQYILNVNFRRDASSKFGPDKKIGNFGSVGAAWVFSQLPSLAESNFLSYGKIKGSYGTSGNDQIADYRYLAAYTPENPYQDLSSLIPSRIANPIYSWETNRKINIGVELSLLSNKLFINAEWYRNRSSNQLVDYPLAAQTGFISFTDNLNALVESKGFELEISYTPIRNHVWNWQTTVNITTPRNKLVKFPDLDKTVYNNTFVVGEPLSVVRGYKFIGLNPTNGGALYEDVDKDGVITLNNDFVTIGNTDPKMYGGLSNSLSYKSIRLDFLLQFVIKDAFRVIGYPGRIAAQPESSLNRWKKPGDENITNIPVATQTSRNPAYVMNSNLPNSSYAFENASYLRLRNVSVTYDLPKSIIESIKLKKAGVYVRIENLVTFTPYNGIDPATPSSLGITPPLKQFVAGLTITF